MAVDTPIDTPAAYDSITIDGIDTPGICTLGAGGVRRSKIDKQVAPGTAGSFSVNRGLELTEVDYDILVWTKEQYRELQALAARLAGAQESQPPRMLRLVDLAVAHLKMKAGEVSWIGPFKRPSPGKWTLGFGLLEWKKRKPIGGVARAKDNLDRETEATLVQNAGLQDVIEAHKRDREKQDPNNTGGGFLPAIVRLFD
jgi:hypothetical protein